MDLPWGQREKFRNDEMMRTGGLCVIHLTRLHLALLSGHPGIPSRASGARAPWEPARESVATEGAAPGIAVSSLSPDRVSAVGLSLCLWMRTSLWPS